MTSLPSESIAYGVVAVCAIAVFAGSLTDSLHMKDRPRALFVFLALTASLTISAIAVFVSAYLRLRHMGALTPQHGLYLRVGIEGGVVAALLSAYWWRFR